MKITFGYTPSACGGEIHYLVQNHFDWVVANIGVMTRRFNFPQKTMFIGIYLPDEDNIIIFEGTHRATAIALANYQNRPIVFVRKPLIAITIFDKSEKVLLDNLLRQGSNKRNSPKADKSIIPHNFMQ